MDHRGLIPQGEEKEFHIINDRNPEPLSDRSSSLARQTMAVPAPENMRTGNDEVSLRSCRGQV